VVWRVAGVTRILWHFPDRPPETGGLLLSTVDINMPRPRSRVLLLLQHQDINKLSLSGRSHPNYQLPTSAIELSLYQTKEDNNNKKPRHPS
jgi:hypothetical protein